MFDYRTLLLHGQSGCGKLSWFLRDFGYNTELLGKDEIDDQAAARSKVC